MTMVTDLTVFVINFGNNPNFDDCIAALEAQSIQGKLEVIQDYAPMSLAFQEMLNRCTTKYYIQVDSDMILGPDAILRLYRSIKTSGKMNAMVCYQLHDVHLDFDIYGVKAYKYDDMKNYPYNLDTISCEMEQLRRMDADGYGYRVLSGVLGDHCPKWTDELIFERYFDLMQKFKKFKYPWLGAVPSKLKDLLFDSPSLINIYALAGALHGIASTSADANGEKNFVVKNKAFLDMKSYLHAPTQATVYMTSKCNFKCKFCLRTLNHAPRVPDVTVSVVRELLDTFPSIRGVCLCGFGEPLLSRHIEPVLGFLSERGVYASLITNGSKLEYYADMLARYKLAYVSVSLNAWNEAAHETETGAKGFFSQVVSGIEAVRDNNIPLYLSYVCHRENLEDVPKFLEFAKHLRVTGVHLHNLLPHFAPSDKAGQKWFEDNVLTVKDLSAIDALRSGPDCDIVSKYPTLIDLERPLRECQSPWDMVGIDGNGDISVCGSIDPPAKEQGNIRDDGVWHNEYCQVMRNKFARDKLPYKCGHCFRNWEVVR